jgi:hypothetical protein
MIKEIIMIQRREVRNNRNNNFKYVEKYENIIFIVIMLLEVNHIVIKSITTTNHFHLELLDYQQK